MKCRKLQPQHHGWIESILDKEDVDFLWGRVEKSEEDVKGRLAGNISTSRAITDDEDQIGASYAELEEAMEYRIGPAVEILDKFSKQNRHKMEPIPTFKL